MAGKERPMHPDLKSVLEAFDSLSGALYRQQASLPAALRSDLETTLPQVREAVGRLQREWLAQQREQEELKALVQVAQVVNSTLDLATVLNQVMDHIVDVDRRRAGVLDVDERGGRIGVQGGAQH